MVKLNNKFFKNKNKSQKYNNKKWFSFCYSRQKCLNAYTISNKCTEIVLEKLSSQLFSFYCLKEPVVCICLRISRQGSVLESPLISSKLQKILQKQVRCFCPQLGYHLQEPSITTAFLCFLRLPKMLSYLTLVALFLSSSQTNNVNTAQFSRWHWLSCIRNIKNILHFRLLPSYPPKFGNDLLNCPLFPCFGSVIQVFLLQLILSGKTPIFSIINLRD